MSAKRAEPAAKAPLYWASPRYVQWVRDQVAAKGWTLKEFARQLKRADPSARATDGSVGLLMGARDSAPIGSNTTLMPAINKVFKIPPPPICDPLDPAAQLRDLFVARWAAMSEREQRAIMSLLGDLAS